MGAFDLQGFESPEEVRQRIGKARLQSDLPRGDVNQQIFQAAAGSGRLLGEGIEGAFGLEQPEVTEARDRQEVLSSVDFTDRDSIKSAIGKLTDPRLKVQLSQMYLSMKPASKKAPKVINVKVGDKTESRQWNPEKGTYEAIGIGESFKPTKGDKAFTGFAPVYANDKLIGYGQKDKSTGKVSNFTPLSRIDGRSKTGKVGKVSRASKEQISTATSLVEESTILGQAGSFNVGFDSDDYTKLGRAVASRAQELQAQAKFVNETLNDTDAMNLAMEELEQAKGTIWEEDIGIISDSKTLKKDIEFAPGMSIVLQNWLGVDEPQGDTAGSGNIEQEQPDGRIAIFDKNKKFLGYK